MKVDDVPIQAISIPDLSQRKVDPKTSLLIRESHQRIEAYLANDDRVVTNFVPCDFELVERAISWIVENHLMVSNRFCEFGSGFGVCTLLAGLHGLDSVGIEIESDLVDHSIQLAEDFEISAEFYCGSFVPQIAEEIELGIDVEHVETAAGDIYEEIGLEMDDFDLFFAYPWPGEEAYFEEVFELGAARGALLLMYGGRNGMTLVRKT